MFRKRDFSPPASLDLTPLVDVVFLLVIFFMVTSTFIKNPGIGVNLPSSKAADSVPKKDIIITIDKDGRVYIGDTEMSFSEVGAYIKRVVTKNPSRTVVLRGDKTIPYAKLIEIMDIVKLAGVNRLSLATERR